MSYPQDEVSHVQEEFAEIIDVPEITEVTKAHIPNLDYLYNKVNSCGTHA